MPEPDEQIAHPTAREDVSSGNDALDRARAEALDTQVRLGRERLRELRRSLKELTERRREERSKCLFEHERVKRSIVMTRKESLADRERLRVLRQKWGELRGELRELRERIKGVKSIRDQSVARISTLRKKKRALRERLDAIRAEKKAINDQIAALKKQLEESI